MRIAFYGAGAVGGHLAVALSERHQVSVVARGANLRAIRTSGLRLRSGKTNLLASIRASDNPAELGEQDWVIVTVKASALPLVAESLPALVGPGTRVVFAQNGIPWWYALDLPLACPPPPPLPILNLAQLMLRIVPATDVFAGLVYTGNEMIAPGVVLNTTPGRNRLDVASIVADGPSPDDLRAALEEVRIASQPVESVRRSLWTKIVVNLTGSLIGLITGNPSSISRTDAMLSLIFLRAMDEAHLISAAAGFPLVRSDPDDLLARLNDHRPSMLQDLEQGRPIEIAEQVMAPLAFARAGSIATPTLDTLAAVARRRALDAGVLRDRFEESLGATTSQTRPSAVTDTSTF